MIDIEEVKASPKTQLSFFPTYGSGIEDLDIMDIPQSGIWQQKELSNTGEEVNPHRGLSMVCIKNIISKFS